MSSSRYRTTAIRPFRTLGVTAAAKWRCVTSTQATTPCSQLHGTTGRREEKPGKSVQRDNNTVNVNILPDLSNHVRQLMRKLPHPVVVVTASEPSVPTDRRESSFRGMTVSSFNTITLSPKPYVSFNVKVPSATYTALRQSRSFLIHILTASSSGAKIANAFARGSNAHGEAFRDIAMKHAEGERVKIFAGEDTGGAPLLAGDGILKILRCKTIADKEIIVEDHVVLIAEVIGIVSPPKVSKALGDHTSRSDDHGHASSLLYGNQAYRAWGPALDPNEESDTTQEGSQGTVGSHIHKTMGLNVRRGDEIEPR